MARNLSDQMGIKGDSYGELNELYADCWLEINGKRFNLRSAPEISDSKSANYNSTTIFGRSSPIRSYSDSSARTISVSFDLYNVDPSTRTENFNLVRNIAVSVHPEYGGSYDPPPICKFLCGTLLSAPNENGDPYPLQCLIMNYNFSYGKETIFDDGMMPFHIAVSLDLEVVHSTQTLPGRSEVLKGKF